MSEISVVSDIRAQDLLALKEGSQEPSVIGEEKPDISRYESIQKEMEFLLLLTEQDTEPRFFSRTTPKEVLEQQQEATATNTLGVSPFIYNYLRPLETTDELEHRDIKQELLRVLKRYKRDLELLQNRIKELEHQNRLLKEKLLRNKEEQEEQDFGNRDVRNER